MRSDVAFCTQCGRPAHAPAEQPMTAPPVTSMPTTAAAAKSSTWLPVTIACGTALVLGGLAFTAFMHKSSDTPVASRATVTPAATVTATSTVIAVVTETAAPEVEQPAAGGQARPSDWAEYEYSGPSTYDVCGAPSYPLSHPMSSGTMPSPGTPEYFTLLSAQAALRALNYGSPQLVVADAQFTDETARALAGFQQRHKVPVTSEVDPATWGALNSATHYWSGTCP